MDPTSAGELHGPAPSPLQSLGDAARRLAAPLRAYFAPVFTLDVRSLALFRIGTGLVHLGLAVWRLADAEALYSDAGVLPRELATRAVNLPWAFKLHFLSGSASMMQLLFVLHALAAVALILGWKTRWATALCWALALGERERNLLAADGGDDVLVLSAFFGAFLPLGATLSLDARRKPAQASSFLGVGSVGLVVQLCCIYFFSALLKSGPTWRVDHSALWWALSLDSFGTPLAPLLRQLPGLCRALTQGTFVLEFLGPLAMLLLARWARVLRTATALGFIALHLGIALCLRIPHFSGAAAAAWVALLPGELWQRLGWKAADGPASPLLPRPARALAAAGMLLALSSNLAALPGASPPWPWVRALTQMLGLSQAWTMFTPDPMTRDGWYIFDARLPDGRHLDLRTRAPVTLERPAQLGATYPDPFWRNLLVNIHSKQEGAPYLPSLASYLCHSWNAAAPAGARAESLEIDFMVEETRAGDPAPPATRDVLFQGACP